MRRPRLWTVRRTAASTLLLLLVLASTAAAPTITGPKTGRITGHVRDQSGAPLANAQVFVVGTALNALTDPKGAYTIRRSSRGCNSATRRLHRIQVGSGQRFRPRRPNYGSRLRARANRGADVGTDSHD